MIEGDVCDLDAANQQREKPQACSQSLGGKSRLLGIAEHYIGEVNAAGWKQRDAGLAAQNRLKPGHCADFAHHLLTYRIGGNQIPGGREHGRPACNYGEQNKSQAFQAGGGCQREDSGCFGVNAGGL